MGVEKRKKKLKIIMRVLKLIWCLISILYTLNLSAQSVYITKTGEKYHKKSCGYLKYSSKKIELEEALNLGYLACKLCEPKEEVVYKTLSSTDKQNYLPTTSRKIIATQCTGKTKSGSQCKRKTKNTSGRCFQH